jgi:hypothetical protein
MKTADTGREITHCFASIASDTIIDVVNPDTGRTGIYSKDLDECRKEYPDAQLMTIQDWCEQKAKRQDTPVVLEPTTRREYWNMLEVLPPACMMLGCFLVGEPYDHHAGTGAPRFAAYFQVGNSYSKANRPMTVKEFKAMLSARSAKAAEEVANAGRYTITGTKLDGDGV